MKTNPTIAEKLVFIVAERTDASTDASEGGHVPGEATIDFPIWLDKELVKLEARHGEFVTRESLQRHFGKSRR